MMALESQSHDPAREPTATLPRARVAEPPAEDELHIPGYVLVRPLGRGAYGQVWQAVRVGTGQDVAIKVFTAPGRLDWRYLHREVDRLLRVAEHPHIVTLFDAGLDCRPPFYAMALLRHGSLAELCADRQPFRDLERAERWFGQMTAALEFAHGKSLLHCDLKPANVLLDEEDNVRLVDFGQSQIRGEAAFALGTLAYMSPEQAVVADAQSIPPDPSVGWDIYSLGATMYTLLAGHPPHAHGGLHVTLTQLDTAAERLAEYRRHVHTTPITPLRAVNQAIDRDLASIIEHCLDPDPRKRYQHIRDVAADLRRRRERRPLSCVPRTGRDVLGKFIRRNLGMVIIVVVAVTALAIAVKTMAVQQNEALESYRSQLNEALTKLNRANREIERLSADLIDVHAPTNGEQVRNLPGALSRPDEPEP